MPSPWLLWPPAPGEVAGQGWPPPVCPLWHNGAEGEAVAGFVLLHFCLFFFLTTEEWRPVRGVWWFSLPRAGGTGSCSQAQDKEGQEQV